MSEIKRRAKKKKKFKKEKKKKGKKNGATQYRKIRKGRHIHNRGPSLYVLEPLDIDQNEQMPTKLVKASSKIAGIC